MHNIQLFINNYEIELNDSVSFAITKTFEDLNNPTIVNNDWSKTVEIPFTNRNNKIFGHIYKADKVVVTGGTENVGVYFNPYLKLSMRLLYNDMLLMFGYAKMNSIKQKDGIGTYNITLNGELGKVFQELKKITFDATAYPEGSGSTYYINGKDYVDEAINKSLVYSSWTVNSQWQSKLYPKWLHVQGGGVIPHPAYKVTDIIGFGPNNAFCDDFDYSSYQSDEVHSKQFTDTLGSGFTEDTGVEPGTAIPNGMLPREIGEYRSYQQLPYIYFNKLFQMFQYKAEEVTGYQFDLDSSWFNTSNPYWYNLVYMLKMFDTKSGDIKNNLYDNLSTSYYSTAYVNIGDWRLNTDYTTEYTYRSNPLHTQYEQEANVLDRDSYHNQFNFGNNALINFHFRYNLYLLVPSQGVSLKDDNALLFTVTATGSNNITKTQQFLVRHNGSTLTYGDAIPVDCGNSGAEYDYAIIIPTIDSYFTLSKADFGSAVTFSTTARWLYNSYPLDGSASGEIVLYYGGSTQSSTVVGTKSTVELIIPANNWFHSGAPFIFNDLWDNEHNIFDEILRYCKMYRILVDVDYDNKKIRFTPSNKYFSGYTIEDWTDKVDYGKDYTIKPVTFEDKYVLFNYDDDSTKMGEIYLEKYGYKYGEKRIITEYNFNEETNELFDGAVLSETKTDNVLSWTNLFDNHKIIYSFPAELYVYTKNEDNRYISNFGAYYFHLGTSTFDTQDNLYMRDVYISDDLPFQQTNNTYFYTQINSEMTNVTTYPLLDIVSGSNVCLFNTPMECWTYRNNYDYTNGIYYNFWQKYINERYNVQNKLLTCYIKLSPLDYYNFAFNKFVKIENQLYMVNKIYDYNAQSLEPTKVDLVTIQNIEGYTTNNYSN